MTVNSQALPGMQERKNIGIWISELKKLSVILSFKILPDLNKGMRRLTKVLISIVLAFAWQQIDAQAIFRSTDTVENSQQILIHKKKAPKPMKHEASFGVRLHTDGWSAYMDFGKILGFDSKHSDMYHNVRVIQFELSEKKSLSEEKTSSNYSNTLGGNNSYIFGKINNFYAFKMGWGFRRMIAGKPDQGTVSIHWVNLGGLALGLLKPYYLDLYSDPQAVKYTPATASDFLNTDLIEGSAGFSKGLSEVKVIPGAHFKSSLHFDFSNNRKTVLAIEVGINAEYYSQPIPIMANQTANPYFVDLFAAVQFGKRW